MINENFKKWALSFSGFDGGDLGNSKKQSIWFCGIEWGGGFPDDKNELSKIFSEDVSVMNWGYSNPNENLKYRFNSRAMKLLSAVNGGLIKDYKNFAREVKPFVQDEKGYCKMNLYPLSFKNTNLNLWSENFIKATGLNNKNEYKTFIEKNRFPILQDLVKKHNPKLIICTGITYKDQFFKAFTYDNPQIKQERIDDKFFCWAKNYNGTVVIVIYFMTGRYGLIKDSSVQKTGEKIRDIIKHSN
ncbi:hypothetical protein [Campylobacter pinnipediorum]|uniref:hypothetical protein n=1 Tax=Campylobacter pinnipediorum TaxID=1965231 RepID=UPI00084DB57B|nr:hypothetical protein [Campylobacter pinnipediorum]